MKYIKIAAAVVTIIVGGVFIAMWNSWSRVETGYEVDLKSASTSLQKKLIEEFGYSDFEDGWLMYAWTNGFREHTNLYVVAMPNTDLKEAIDAKAESDIMVESLFQNGSYLSPSKPPEWWDTNMIDVVSARYHRTESDLWRFTWIDNHLYIVHRN